MDDQQLLALLERYHKGMATAEEEQQLEEWYSSMTQRESFFAGDEDRQAKLSQLLQLLHGQINAQRSGEAKPVVKIERARLRWRMTAAAAIVMIVAGSWWFYQSQQRPGLLVQHTVIKAAIPETQHSAQLHNTSGKAMTAVLPDGSVAKLSAGAGITYDTAFTAGGHRAVYIKGKVFFDVARDKAHPFTVHSGAFVTTALGTSFSVSENAGGIQVVLFTGKVVVKAESKRLAGWNGDVFLSPGEQLQYNIQRATVTITKTASPAIRKQPLIFEYTALNEVMEQLQRQYQVSIDYDNAALKEMHFSGTIQPTDSLAILLRAIAQMNGLTITPKADGFTVTVSGK